MTALRDRLALYVVTDPDLGRGRSVEEQTRLALEGGATAIQLRMKEGSSRRFYEAACRVCFLCRYAGALCIVNDRLDIALAADADGVHLGQSDLPCEVARGLAPEGFVIGVSAHTPGEAVRARADGADYLGVGAVYPTGSKEDASTCGLEGLRDVREAVALPIVAIGGITAARLPEVRAAGADGAAVISAVAAADDPAAAARVLREAW